MSVTAKALWSIESHLEDDLSLELIARNVGVSRYHLSRAFSTDTAMAQHSTCGLAASAKPPRLCSTVRQTSFPCAFKQHFGPTPEQARAQRATTTLKLLEPIRRQTTTATRIALVRIADRDAMLIFGLSQHYTPQSMGGIPSQWDRFLPHFGHIPTQVDKVAYGVICNTDDTGNIEYI